MIVPDNAAEGNGFTVRSVTADEVTAIQALWAAKKKVRDDPAGVREETADEAAAGLPLLKRLRIAFDALDASTQAAFYGIKTAVHDALDEGRVNVAKLIIQNATVPDEIAPVKAAMLAMFPAE